MPTIFSKLNEDRGDSPSEDEKPTKVTTDIKEIAFAEIVADDHLDRLRQRGSWTVYSYYMASSGWLASTTFCVGIAIASVFFSITSKSRKFSP